MNNRRPLHAFPSLKSSPPFNSSRLKMLGAGCFGLGGIQYLLAEKITALSWQTPAYRYSQNYISDLGIALCGTTADGREICSPLHAVMNLGFALEGVLFFIACWLLRSLFSGPWRGVFLVTGLIHAVGGVMIAVFHSGGASSGITLHQIGAVMAIAGGNLCLLSAGWILRHRRIYGPLSLLAGVVGLVCMTLINSGNFPVGLIERASVYPITGWQILTGVYLLVTLWRSR